MSLKKFKSRNCSILLDSSPSFRKSWTNGKITEIIQLPEMENIHCEKFTEEFTGKIT